MKNQQGQKMKRKHKTSAKYNDSFSVRKKKPYKEFDGLGVYHENLAIEVENVTTKKLELFPVVHVELIGQGFSEEVGTRKLVSYKELRIYFDRGDSEPLPSKP